jgi:protein-disulfide isomerase
VAKTVKPTPTKSRGPFFALLALVAVAGGGGIWYATQSKPAPIALPAGTPLPAAEGYLYGNAHAPVAILEFADFECPGCAQFATLVTPDVKKRLVDAGLASFRFYDFPLTQIHANSMAAHLAAACAADQGKFWEMHDLIFQGQFDWNSQATTNPKKVLQTYLAAAGVEPAAWNACFDSQQHVGRIMANQKVGMDRAVSSTPTLVIGDRVYPGGLSYDQIKKLVDSIAVARQGVVPQVAPPAAR